MVVLSVAAAGVILPFSAGAAMNMEGSRRALAAKLASDYLEEIENCKYAYSYDDIVPYYNNYFQSEGTVTDAEWNTLTDDAYRRFSRVATCEEVNIGGLLVTAIIYYDGKEMLRMSRLIGPD
jgi:hypothetical protein